MCFVLAFIPTCCALDVNLRISPWVDNFRGATRAVTIVAEDAGGQRLGSLGLEELPVQALPRPLLSGLIVEPAHRRRGIARQLVFAAEDQARDWGHSELVLYVEASSSALNFYDAIGFVDANGARCVRQEADRGPKWLSWLPSGLLFLHKDL